MNDSNNDLFDNKLMDQINSRKTDTYKMLELDEVVLKSLDENEIFIIDQRSINRTYKVRFFKKEIKILLLLCANSVLGSLS